MTPAELERLREIIEDMRATIYGPQNTWELCDFMDEIRSNFEDLEAFLASVQASAGDQGRITWRNSRGLAVATAVLDDQQFTTGTRQGPIDLGKLERKS